MAIRVLHVGLGPIGVAVARQVASRKGLRIVGAVDIDPAKVGRDLGEVAELGKKLRVKVGDDIGKAIKKTEPDVVALCTSSSLASIEEQLASIFKRKVPVVSTTEELAYPYYSNKKLAKRIDAAARKAKVAVVGTGVNPGFTMDALPIALTAVCERVDAIHVDRIQDASVRRLPFQQKIGAGLSRAAFQKRVDAGTVRHVGLTESIAMIADAMGWKLERITDEIEPKMAAERTSSQFLTVEPGQVAGIIQDGVGYRDGKPIITLHMEAYLGAPESYDAVRITGSPPLYSKIAGGVQGDIATASITVNTIPAVLAARPGLHTMRSLRLPSFYPG
ncbi:MAG: dihydrodipicolinate reductase [Gemmatimonadales bacterium]